MTTTINASTSAGLVQTADTSGSLALQTANTTAVTIDTSQNVGIGTSSPQSKLEVRQSSSGAIVNGLTLSNYLGSGAVGTGVALWLDPNGAGSNARSASIQSAQASSGNFADLRFLVSNSATPAEAMRIDSSGNVGIGTSSPTQKLQVAGNAFISAGQYFMWDNAGAWSLQSDASTYVRTFINGNEKLRVNAYGIGIGGAIPSSGTGITFPATQSASSDANTLDDYEEGTWTPTLSFAGGSTGITYQSGGRLGKYTKIGNMVYAGVFISLSSKGSSTGQASISGLPFTATSSQEGRMGTCAGYFGNFNTISNILLLVEPSGTNSQLRYGSSGGAQDLLDTLFQNGSSIYGVYIYQV